jgi:hypothetical protein
MRRIIGTLAALVLAFIGSFVLVPAAQATECTNDTKSVLTHTWVGKTGALMIEHTGTKRLCKPLHIANTSFTYDTPEKGQWPQTKLGVVRGSIQNPGDKLILLAPEVCGQRDAYAGYGEEPQPSDYLTAPGKPYEPKFVHNFSKGSNTYGHDDPKSCIPQDVIMPEATVGTICEIGMSSAVVQLINAMSDIGGTFLVKTSDGREFVVNLAAGKIDELMFTFEGTIIITVTAVFGDKTYDVVEQTVSDEGCAQPPIVVSKPKAQIADAVCVADAEGYRLVTVTNKSFVENPLPNTDYMSAAAVSFTIKSSDGFSQTIVVQAGQTEKVKVPLVEDKKVTVTVSVTDTGKVLAKESFVSNCSVTEIIPPSVTPPTVGEPPTLADTGASPMATVFLLALAVLSLVVGFPAAIYGYRRPKA